MKKQTRLERAAEKYADPANIRAQTKLQPSVINHMNRTAEHFREGARWAFRQSKAAVKKLPTLSDSYASSYRDSEANTFEKLLLEIEGRVSLATKGPWNSRYGNTVYGDNGDIHVATLNDGEYIENANRESDSDFIAHSRTDIETLAKIVRVQSEALYGIIWNDTEIDEAESRAKEANSAIEKSIGGGV